MKIYELICIEGSRSFGQKKFAHLAPYAVSVLDMKIVASLWKMDDFHVATDEGCLDVRLLFAKRRVQVAPQHQRIAGNLALLRIQKMFRRRALCSSTKKIDKELLKILCRS